jgi:hypothetical protein
MSIDASIDRLCGALSALGFQVAEGPDDAAAWETLDHELAPLALPTDLRRLLQRVDVARLPLRTYPAPTTLSFALWSWREFRDGGGFAFPAGLFPWCYESHNHLFVELDGPKSTVARYSSGHSQAARSHCASRARPIGSRPRSQCSSRERSIATRTANAHG